MRIMHDATATLTRSHFKPSSYSAGLYCQYASSPRLTGLSHTQTAPLRDFSFGPHWKAVGMPERGAHELYQYETTAKCTEWENRYGSLWLCL